CGLVEIRRAGHDALPIPVIHPMPGWKVDVLRALSDTPDRSDENVVAVEELLPQVADTRILRVVEHQGLGDRAPGPPRLLRAAIGVWDERMVQDREEPVDVDHLLIVVGFGRHVPRSVRAGAADLHDRREGAELDPAREDLPIAELLVAAGIRAPDGK